MGYRNDSDALLMQVESLRRDLDDANKNSSEHDRIKKELEVKINELKESRISAAEREIAASEISAKATKRGVILTIACFALFTTIVFFGLKWRQSTQNDKEGLKVDWLSSIKPKCNSVEVAIAVKQTPPPADWQGQADLATCFALAHKIDESRRVLTTISNQSQSAATQRLFNYIHPVADAGDDVAAGPVMEMIVEFTPHNFMAVYHAGMSAHQTKRPLIAKQYLESFLKLYSPNDSWKKNALAALKDIESTK